MIPILYDSTATDFTVNGLARLVDCIDCVVTEGRNDIYECDFSYPVNGHAFELIRPGRIICVTHDETGDIQPFDIVSYTRGIDGIVDFHAVHVSYRLTKQVVIDTPKSSLADALAALSAAAPGFTFRTDFSSTATMTGLDGKPHTVRELIGGIQGSLLDTYGGELKWDNFSVSLLKSRGQARPLKIRYGVNLKDYVEDADYSETYTAVIPYYSTDSDLVIGSKVDPGFASYNDRQEVVPMDLSSDFENPPTAAQLEAKALQRMMDSQPATPHQTISVDFVRIHSDSNPGLDALMTCGLCDTIATVLPMYGVETSYKVVKTTWDVLTERYINLELGTLGTTLAQALGLASNNN